MKPLPTWLLATFAAADFILAVSSFLVGAAAFGIFLVVAGAACVLAILFRP